MRIGLQINRFDWPGNPENIGSKLAEIAVQADQSGFYSLWVMDHFFQLSPMLGNADDPMLESYNTLGYLAGVTKNIKLGTLVTGVIYRHPAHLIKSVTTLDVLSGGRAYLGIGAAWYEREADGLGFAFPPLSMRFNQLEETLQIAHQMWSDDRSPYNGDIFQMANPINSPKPLSKPHPPILIGGGGEKKTLYLVAKYADACNLFVRLGNEELSKKLDILKEHCEHVGRDYREIEKTALLHLNLDDPKTSLDQIVDKSKQLHKLGFEHLIVSLQNVHQIEPIKIIEREVLPAIQDL